MDLLKRSRLVILATLALLPAICLAQAEPSPKRFSAEDEALLSAAGFRRAPDYAATGAWQATSRAVWQRYDQLKAQRDARKRLQGQLARPRRIMGGASAGPGFRSPDPIPAIVPPVGPTPVTRAADGSPELAGNYPRPSYPTPPSISSPPVTSPPATPSKGAKGEKGDRGEKGEKGDPGQVTDQQLQKVIGSVVEILAKDGRFKGAKGDKGDPGIAADPAELDATIVNILNREAELRKLTIRVTDKDESGKVNVLREIKINPLGGDFNIDRSFLRGQAKPAK